MSKKSTINNKRTAKVTIKPFKNYRFDFIAQSGAKKRKKPYTSILLDRNYHQIIELNLSHIWQSVLISNADDARHNQKNCSGLSEKGYQQFLMRANRLISQRFSQNDTLFLYAHKVLLNFVIHQNETTRLKPYYYPLPILPVTPSPKANPIRIPSDWVSRGKLMNQIIKHILADWNRTVFYHDFDPNNISHIKTVAGWLVFSGIIFGGINDKRMLQAWFYSLLNQEIQPFIQQRILVNIRYRQDNYGNERDELTQNLYNSQQICVDLVSQAWLFWLRKVKQADLLKIANMPVESLLQQNLYSVLPSDLRKLAKFNFLLATASYHWEVLPNVRVNQALVRVLQGKERTVGLEKGEFNALSKTSLMLSNKQYDINQLNQILIENPPEPKNTHKIDTSSLKAKIKISDLIKQIKDIFRKDYRQFAKSANISLNQQNKYRFIITELQALLSQYRQMGEQILIAWVIDFLQQPNPIQTKSIETYLSSIGDDWLYFTHEQDLKHWDEEDFEVTYEELLDFKRLELGNTDISYPAGRLQQLHDFAHQYFHIVDFDIPEASPKRKVRAEWVSPLVYQAILAQIKQSIDPLETDMLMVLIMLAMRTGLRKMELLGLKYGDIENLAIGQPAIMIRPNQYRRLKTQGSVRRIPAYAILTDREHHFLIDYLQYNKGKSLNQLIFTLSTDNVKLSSSLPGNLLNQILPDIGLVKDSLHLHGFRHTAISNLSLILTADIELTQFLTGLSIDEIQRIKQQLMTDEKANQMKWHKVAGIAGHLSPNRSFEYYNHFAVLSATYEVTKANIFFPLATLQNITGIDNKTLSENHVTSDETVNLAQLRQLFFRETLNRTYRTGLKLNQLTPKANNNLFENPLVTTGELFNRYRLTVLLHLLKQIDEGMKLEEIIHANKKLSLEDLMKLQQRAIVLAQRLTIRDNARLVKRPDTISPMSLQLTAEKRMLRHILNQSCQLRHTQFEDWQWFLQRIYQGIANSQSSLSFPINYNSLLELERFIGITQAIFPKDTLMIASHQSIESIIRQVQAEQQAIVEHTNQGKKGRKAVTHIHDFSLVYQAGLLDKNNKNLSQNKMLFKLDKWLTTIHIGIAVKNPHKKQFQYQFSGILRFFAHMMLLQDERISLTT